MAEESDPPRKFYQLKSKEFETVNDRVPAPLNPDGTAAPDPGPSAADTGRIDVRDHFQRANARGPSRSAVAKPGPPLNDVQVLMRENATHARATGLDNLAPQARRRSRRARDYWLALAVSYGFIALTVVLIGPNLMTLGFGIGGGIIVTFALTWIIWFVLDDY